jgi:FkbM family methyltransferase
MKAALKRIAKGLGYDVRRIEHLPQVSATGSVVEWPHGNRRIRFYVENRFDLIGRDMFNGRFFEEEELAYLQTVADPSGTFLDIGANVGNHTVFFAAVIGAARVHAFEPGDFAYPRLAFNIALNGLESRVTAHRLALSDRDGTAAMRFNYADNHGSFSITDGEGAEQSVPIARGDAVVGAERIRFAKIDVERHEFEVLQGLAQTIARDKPLLMVEIDLTDRPRLDAWMAANGYREQRAFPRYGDIVNVVAAPA